MINRTKNIEKVDSCFDLRNKDLIDNVLVSLGDNNKLFVCYSGYKIVDYWKSSAGYRIKPVVGGTSNVLTEIDLCTKKEYVFDQPDDLSDIMNNPQCQHASPVNDIARWKDNYYVAHGSSIYMYRSSNPWFTSPKLLRTYCLVTSSTDKDPLKKIFIDKDENIVAISFRGLIFKKQQPVWNDNPMELICSCDTDEEIYSYAYDATNNMVLLGKKNFAQIVLLNNPIKIFKLVMDQLRIHTIDTNDNYILLSDIVQNTNRKEINNYKAHLKLENCCTENETPYDQWQECEKCIQDKKEWEQKKEKFYDTKLTFSITEKPQEILAAVQKYCKYDIPFPKACEHRICPHSDTLIASCKQNTILLLSLSKLMETMNQKTDVTDINLFESKSDLIVHRIEHRDKSHPNSEDNSRISHISLTKNFLLIAKSIVSSYFYDYIYNIPLEKIESMQSSQEHHRGFDFLGDAWAASSLNWNILYDASKDGDYMRICKNNIENVEKICAASICTYCKKGCQGIVCGNPEHRFQYVANVNLFTHPDDTIKFNLTESLKRMSRNFILSCIREYKIILYDRRIQFGIAVMIACGIGIIKCLIELENNSPAFRL